MKWRNQMLNQNEGTVMEGWGKYLQRHSLNCNCSICYLDKVGFIVPRDWNAFNSWYRFAWKTTKWRYYIVVIRHTLPLSRKPKKGGV
jgi:hypothetical protein